MSKQYREGDVVELTNTSDVPTRNDLPATVSGFVGYWQNNGVKPGKRGSFIVRFTVRDTVTGPAGGLNEGDTLYIDGRTMYGAIGVAAGSAGAKPFAKVLRKLAAGEEREIEMRLING